MVRYCLSSCVRALRGVSCQRLCCCPKVCSVFDMVAPELPVAKAELPVVTAKPDAQANMPSAQSTQTSKAISSLQTADGSGMSGPTATSATGAANHTAVPAQRDRVPTASRLPPPDSFVSPSLIATRKQLVELSRSVQDLMDVEENWLLRQMLLSERKATTPASGTCETTYGSNQSSSASMPAETVCERASRVSVVSAPYIRASEVALFNSLEEGNDVGRSSVIYDDDDQALYDS